jgi:hypothetical protein
MRGGLFMKKWLDKIRYCFFTSCPETGNIKGINLKSAVRLLLFPLTGLMALLWILIRVIPKPDRAAYPCMKVAFPVASTFIIYIISMLTSLFAVHRARHFFARSKPWIGLVFITLAILTGAFTFLYHHDDTFALSCAYEDPLGPNAPIGEAKGIFPGRVIWVHDPNATNENCVPDNWNDGYFLDKNCNQDIVDQMLAEGLLELTGETTETTAWDSIFHYFNRTHEKGDAGYSAGEIIFIKINSVHASSWAMNADYSIKPGGDYGNVDTSPHAVFALLKQLVNNAGVPQENIYVGDPFRDIYKHCYDKWHAEFPDVNYCSNHEQTGRLQFVPSDSVIMYYSDKGAVMDGAVQESYFTILYDADYIINLPAMKGHRWGGVTFFAKNFFGTVNRWEWGDYSAYDLHKGLCNPDNTGMRDDYRMYRVFVDIMGHESLGGKTLVYIMDGLWASSYEHYPPEKFLSVPFNNDWCSSILVSLDPVAIESVCLDILQAEFTEENLVEGEPRNSYVLYGAVDDYLHQAADTSWWPDGISYDPENDGTPIGSLGTHEHWNNPIDRQYSRNLNPETGEGIELIQISKVASALETPVSHVLPDEFVLHQNYPNPFNPFTTISYDLLKPAKVQLAVYNNTGQLIRTLVQQFQQKGSFSILWQGTDQHGRLLPSGVYMYQLRVNDGNQVYLGSKKMVLVK